MQKLIDGLKHYMRNIHQEEQALFDLLATGQSPKTCIVTCSDSRVDPALIMQADPGDLFVLRNAGNIVPPHGAPQGGEGATLEYAVSALGVEDIIICGHSDCGAIKGVLTPGSCDHMPEVKRWLQYSESVRRIVDERPDLTGVSRINAAIEINVLTQLAHLHTLPFVAAKTSSGKLSLHGWVYDISTGVIRAFDPQEGIFKPLHDSASPLEGMPSNMSRILTHNHDHTTVAAAE